VPRATLAAGQSEEPQSRLQLLRRGELLGAAVAVIGEEGLSRLTLARVAARVGMSAASVNFHFATKVNLLRDTLDAVVQEFHDTISSIIARHSDDPLLALEAITAAHFEPPLFDHGKAVVWYAFSAESARRNEYRNLSVPRYERYRAQVSALFHQLATEGRIDSRLDATTISTAFIALLDSLSFDFMLDPESFDPQAATGIATKFLHGLIEIAPPGSGQRKSLPLTETRRRKD
jgi:TetR/AcrR family transcriptional repressor of bet genes